MRKEKVDKSEGKNSLTQDNGLNAKLEMVEGKEKVVIGNQKNSPTQDIDLNDKLNGNGKEEAENEVENICKFKEQGEEDELQTERREEDELQTERLETERRNEQKQRDRRENAMLTNQNQMKPNLSFTIRSLSDEA